ncbi:MAG: hypothetical protein WD771_11310 [Gemmatimonadaceae bacterium]
MRVLARGANDAQLAELDRSASSTAFTDLEKAALAYAEAMTFSDREVDDALFARPRRFR